MKDIPNLTYNLETFEFPKTLHEVLDSNYSALHAAIEEKLKSFTPDQLEWARENCHLEYSNELTSSGYSTIVDLKLNDDYTPFGEI